MNGRSATYYAYLQSDHWKNLRKQKLILGQSRCFNCGNTEELHVHHMRYRNLTDCSPDDLLLLCATCHDDLHVALKILGAPIEAANEGNITDVLSRYRGTKEYAKRQAKLLRRRENRAQVRKNPPCQLKPKRTKIQEIKAIFKQLKRAKRTRAAILAASDALRRLAETVR